MTKWVLETVVILVLSSLVFCQTQSNSTLNYLDDPYCFRFTWLGPKIDPDTDLVGFDCDDVMQTKTPIGIPCVLPLVITDNTNSPNTTTLWNQFRDSNPAHIACRQSRGNVCVKYTFRYNQQVENITYFCSKVTIQDEGPTTYGCYSEYRDGREVEVCVCKSSKGDKPCNSSLKLNGISMIMLMVALTFIIYMFC